jgi:tetratricopeptide (TPR) repeat protein
VDVGERLKRARLKGGLTQGELAAPDYSAAYVSVIESGKRDASEKVLRHFARRLGITYEELATGRPPDAEATLEQEIASARQDLSSGSSATATASFRRVMKRASQYGLERVQERAALGEAFAYEVTGDPARAEKIYESLQEAIPDERVSLKADAVAGRARCIRMQGDVSYSIYVLEGFLSHLQRNGLLDPEAVSRIQISLVGAYFESGMTARAGVAANTALELSPKVKDKEKLAGMHINLARVLMERHEFEGAARSYATAEKLYAELGLQAEIGRAHLARAFLMKTEKQFTEARAELEEALRIFEATGATVNEARALSELGAVDRLQGRLDEAVFVLSRAVKSAKSEPASAAISHRELALCYAETGDAAKMRSNFKKAIDLLESSGDKYELALTYRSLGDALRDEKDYEKACGAYRSAAVALAA